MISKPWFISGIVASVLYGVSAIFFKLLTEEKYLGGKPAWVLGGIGTGIALCGLIGFYLFPNSSASSAAPLRAYLWAVPAGIVNGFATLLILRALQSPDTNVSQLVPLYNTNTLVAFILAVILFREFPTGGELLKNLAGAILIVAGTMLIGGGK